MRRWRSVFCCVTKTRGHADQPTLLWSRVCLLLKRKSLFLAAVTALLVTAGGARPMAAQFMGLGSKPPSAPVVIPTLQAPQPGFVFPAKQTLTFTVDWRVFTAGSAVFHLEQVGNEQRVTATADTVGAVTMLFPVTDRFQAGLDTKTGCSTGFSKQLSEGVKKGHQRADLRLCGGQAEAGGEEPGEGDTEGTDRVHSGVRNGFAVGDLLCGFAADGGGGSRYGFRWRTRCEQ